jgi:CRP-like cAMP-binding protein
VFVYLFFYYFYFLFLFFIFVGECIVKQGDIANGFYIIVSGRINVSAIGPNGQEIHLNTLTKKDWFGNRMNIIIILN